MLDWIFEGIVTWVGSIVAQMMDAVSGMFLDALGADMSTLEEYFPFVTKAFTVMQYTAWAVLFLVTVWQLFRVFGGPVTEAENPWTLLARGGLFALLIAYAKPVFLTALDIARAPYTAMMEIPMTAEDFSFAGVEQTLSNGLATVISVASVVGLLLLIILEVSLGWNYFKLLLEAVERYVVVGVLCYTSPLAFSMGASQTTAPVFKSWCRMVGSQLLLMVMNVWFLRGFHSSVGQYIGNGGALSSGHGSIFLWFFCALAFLKVAQKFDGYLSSLGMSVAQTGGSMGMELLMAARVIGGGARSVRSAGGVFGGRAAGASAASSAAGFASGLAARFKGNSYVRDAVVDGGVRMGAGGGIGFVGRAFGGMAARNGASLTGESISSVASRSPDVSGSIAGEIADRSLSNYMPQLEGYQLRDTRIGGGHISTSAVSGDGDTAAVEMFDASRYEKPEGPYTKVTASDGSQWYLMASGEGFKEFYPSSAIRPGAFSPGPGAAVFPERYDGTDFRQVDDGILEASGAGGSSLWYSSAFYEKPDAPHTVVESSDGIAWYAMERNADPPRFEDGGEALAYNQAQFQAFMPGYAGEAPSGFDGSGRNEGRFEVRHEDGSGTMFYDSSRYAAPRGDYRDVEDVNGGRWYAVHGQAAVARRPVYENGKPVYGSGGVKTTSVETVSYGAAPKRFEAPKERGHTDIKPPKRKQ
ncbi:MAG: hypothetical protein HFI89_04570 [Lachnospiraceae bacterium]|nr:hypothetical protein [Lachnospiraceae bacterium]